MKVNRFFLFLLITLCIASAGSAAPRNPAGKVRLLVVSSYHREYIWTQETNRGFCDAMLKVGYFDNQEQAAEYTRNDSVETSKVIVKKLWLDSKRKSKKSELESRSRAIYKIAREFQPDLLLLGDDEAVQYVDKWFLDSAVPVVFWGVNNTPVKYGLVDRPDRPDHNVTGVYQSGYYVESVKLLKSIVPRLKTFAVLSDETPTGRSHAKAMEYLARNGAFPLTLVETVSTDNYEVWKTKVLELQQKVDAFFIAAYAALKDDAGAHVPVEEVTRWYLSHVKIPEAVELRHFVQLGMLCGAEDSGYNQAYEAVRIAHDILASGARPASYPPRAPKRGALIVNLQRAKMLGIPLTNGMGIEEYVDEAGALKDTGK